MQTNKLVADCNGDSIWTNRRIASAMPGRELNMSGRTGGRSLLRKAKLARSGLEAPDRHPKEQQREQERRSFATQNWWRFNKCNFEGRTVLVRAVGARAISGSFCSGKTLSEIKSGTDEKLWKRPHWPGVEPTSLGSGGVTPAEVEELGKRS